MTTELAIDGGRCPIGGYLDRVGFKDSGIRQAGPVDHQSRANAQCDQKFRQQEHHVSCYGINHA